MADYILPRNSNKNDKRPNITYKELEKLYYDNFREEEEGKRLTAEAYEKINKPFKENKKIDPIQFIRESSRDPQISGLRVQYPHGTIIQQSMRRNYYRGEREIYPESIPSLLRKLKKYDNKKDKELYRLVADMRIKEFEMLLNRFEHVKEWKDSDVLYEILAQHYGLETCWLDITSDFNVALFFANCRYDNDAKCWYPLTNEETHTGIEEKKYGIIYHIPSSIMTLRWDQSLDYFSNVLEDDKEHYRFLEHPIYRGLPQNLVYPIGFQPFMRCHMQNAYGIYMRNDRQPLNKDTDFEILIFEHDENFARWIYEEMDKGKLIYPHEGLKDAQFIIDDIANTTQFSEAAYYYALQRNHYYRLEDDMQCRKDLAKFVINDSHIEIMNRSTWKLSSGRCKKINKKYEYFNLQDWYNIQIITRKVIPAGSGIFQHWMLMEEENELGTIDMQSHELQEFSSLWSRYLISILASKAENVLSDF